MDTGNKTRKYSISLAILALGAFGMVSSAVMASPKTGSPRGQQAYGAFLDKQVRHEIGMLTRYSVFDFIDYKIQGSEVTLTGEVVNSTTKHEILNATKRIEGVTRVVDEINILPASQFDSQIRRAEFQVIFSDGSLGQYAMGVVPTIHIIVNHGHVTLEGKVDSEADRNLATLRANSVPGVFSVMNNLRVE
jgi:hyperosmotically inducible protein